MSATRLESMVGDHLRKLSHVVDYGQPVLPSVAAYLRLLVDDDDANLLMLSSVDVDAREGRLLGFTDDLLFLLRVRSVRVDHYDEFHVDGPVLPLSALRAVRLRSESTVRGSDPLPSADLLIDGVDEPVHVGPDGEFRVPRGFSDADAAATWRRVFGTLRVAARS